MHVAWGRGWGKALVVEKPVWPNPFHRAALISLCTDGGEERGRTGWGSCWKEQGQLRHWRKGQAMP